MRNPERQRHHHQRPVGGCAWAWTAARPPTAPAWSWGPATAATTSSGPSEQLRSRGR